MSTEHRNVRTKEEEQSVVGKEKEKNHIYFLPIRIDFWSRKYVALVRDPRDDNDSRIFLIVFVGSRGKGGFKQKGREKEEEEKK